MNKEEEHNLSYVIINGGLFQIYQEPTLKFENYENMFTKLFNTFSIDKQNQIKNTILSSNIKSISQLNENIYSITQTPLENIFNISNFQTINLKYLNELTKDTNLYFIYNNMLELYLDHSIINQFTLIENKHRFIFDLQNSNEFNTLLQQQPKQFIIFDFNLGNLYNYHLKGHYTVYLTHLIKIMISYPSNYIKDVNTSNLDILKKHSCFFDFSLFYFTQINNYRSLIININKANISNIKADSLSLKKQLQTKINCLVIYRYYYKNKELQRSHLFNCNDNVNYISYTGSLGIYETYDDLMDLSLQNKFDAIIAKFSDASECKQYYKFIEEIKKYLNNNKNVLCMTNLHNVNNYLERENMVTTINDFILYTKENNKLVCPKSFAVYLDKVYEYEQFSTFMKDNNLIFPLIMKYAGPKNKYNHLLVNIITENGLANYINYIKEFSKEEEKTSIYQIVQQYVNHGGYVIKGYRINKQSFFFYRPSFPDVSADLVNKFEEYKDGFYHTSTTELVGNTFKQFWEKVPKLTNIQQCVDESYLGHIMELFEEYSKDTLFGCDFLYDYVNNKYYLVDINQYPGYKELIPQFNDIITQHILKYCNK